MGYVAPFSMTGNPVVTLRLGFVGGRPLGIQVISQHLNCFACNYYLFMKLKNHIRCAYGGIGVFD